MITNRHLIPFDDLELSRILQLLERAGVENALERLPRVRWKQIVYSFSWTRNARPTVANATEERFSHILAHASASIITGIQASAVGAELVVEDTSVVPSTKDWARYDDPLKFAAARNPLDYIRAQVKPSSTEQVATREIPLSHLVNAPERGFMPSLLDYVPGGNFSSYEVLLTQPADIYVPRVDISLTAILMEGL